MMYKKGFTIFIAVVVSGLLLIVVLSISNIALKETILSGAGRESELAFYAADSGVECALFWDWRNSSGNPAFTSPVQDINCGVDVDYISPTGGVGYEPNDYPGFDPGDPGSDSKPSCLGGAFSPMVSDFIVNFENGTCAQVRVEKCYNGSVLETTIESQGRSSCNVADPRRFERGIEVFY